MRFEALYQDYSLRKLTQQDAAKILGVSDRTFRRYLCRYESDGLSGLIDRRIEQASHRKALVDEVLALQDCYRREYPGFNAKHFYSWYKRDGGVRSYTWVKTHLQEAKLIRKAPGKGKHRKRRERSAMAGMMIHQDASSHQWVEGKYWDLVVTMDDATNEHYSMFFVDEEGTASSFQGVKETILAKGLFCSFYSDRGHHYWHTPKAGGKVDKDNLTQFGRAMRQLGIDMIAAYSPQARGRSERAFSTHQGRLPQELAKANITNMKDANHYLKTVYMPAFNQEFSVKAANPNTAFVPLLGLNLDDILCEHYQRTVAKDNCISFEGKRLQIPPCEYRMHYSKVKVSVHKHINGNITVFHGPRCIACFNQKGELTQQKVAA